MVSRQIAVCGVEENKRVLVKGEKEGRESQV